MLRRPTNAEVRPREYLTATEVETLIKAARQRSRYADRDSAAILLSYRHGFRVSELCALRWDQIDLESRRVHVRRVKRGTPSVHPLGEQEIGALKRLKAQSSIYVFTTERGGPMTPGGVRKMLSRTGEAAGFTYPVHPHMLRHGCGYKLANDGRDTRAIQCYLGHRSISATVRYTELCADRFRGFWDD